LNGLLGGLSPEQRRAVLADDEPLCVLAGPGSGKTTVLTRRVARRVLDTSASPERTAVLTFTRKAAHELRHRLSDLDVPGHVWAGTFHSAALTHLRRHWADRGVRPPAVLDDPRRLLRRIADDVPVDAPVVAAIATEIHWAQVHILGPAQFPARAEARGRTPPSGLTLDDVGALYTRYVDEKERRGVMDLDDLVTRSAHLLDTDAEACAAQRWRTRHVFVDEFQDVNPAQWRLLSAWLGDRRDLFVVGDPHQAIYSWNGADPALLDRLPELLPGTTVLRLDDNHRCTPQIEAASRTVLGAADVTRRATRPDGAEPVVRAFDDDGTEAAGVVRWLRLSHRPGRSWSQLAVLARTNARLQPVADTLARAGIPHRLASARSSVARRLVTGALTGTTPGATPTRGRQHRSRSLRSAVAELVVSAGLDGDDDAGDEGHRRHDVLELVRLADELAVDAPDATVSDFLAWLATQTGPDVTVDAVDTVTLSTFHRAKGLQWPAVALVGIEDGVVPIAYARTADAVAEERRLLYVAVTRAEDELWCSWAAERRVGDQSWRCHPSPFLAGLVDRAYGVPERPPGGAWPSGAEADVSERLARLRARLADTA
jgi:DNA helicase-2/ATP-dependent DNA helicase PcrA